MILILRNTSLIYSLCMKNTSRLSEEQWAELQRVRNAIAGRGTSPDGSPLPPLEAHALAIAEIRRIDDVIRQTRESGEKPMV